MTLQIELTPEQEAWLAEVARRQGMDMTRYARWMLGIDTPAQTGKRLTEEEWQRLEEELSWGIDPDIPPLSEEALSRSSIYGHRA